MVHVSTCQCKPALASGGSRWCLFWTTATWARKTVVPRKELPRPQATATAMAKVLHAAPDFVHGAGRRLSNGHEGARRGRGPRSGLLWGGCFLFAVSFFFFSLFVCVFCLFVCFWFLRLKRRNSEAFFKERCAKSFI